MFEYIISNIPNVHTEWSVNKEESETTEADSWKPWLTSWSVDLSILL